MPQTQQNNQHKHNKQASIIKHCYLTINHCNPSSSVDPTALLYKSIFLPAKAFCSAFTFLFLVLFAAIGKKAVRQFPERVGQEEGETNLSHLCGIEEALVDHGLLGDRQRQAADIEETVTEDKGEEDGPPLAPIEAVDLIAIFQYRFAGTGGGTAFLPLGRLLQREYASLH